MLAETDKTRNAIDTVGGSLFAVKIAGLILSGLAIVATWILA